MDDVFRPKNDNLVSAIYNAFHDEAVKREGRSKVEWMDAERQAVLNAAVYYATHHGLRVPTEEEVMRAEIRSARFVDFGSAWAYGVRYIMMNPPEQGVIILPEDFQYPGVKLKRSYGRFYVIKKNK